MDLVSLYVDQVGADDLSRERATRHPTMKIYPTIAETVTGADGVVVVGEHGDYPKTEKGQVQYPRYRFFEEITKVYRDSGRPVPMFNDKHLSWNWEWARKMYDVSREMNFAYMAGSSLPVTWRIPSVEMPLESRISEALCTCYGGVDSYDFHGLETIQCMVERRRGGESGVKWVEAYRGDRFWEALREGVWPMALLDAALCRSHTLATAGFPTLDDMRRLVKDPVAYRYEHNDGLKCTMLLLGGLIRDFNFAAYVDGKREPWSTQMYLPMPDGRTTLANFFSPQVNNIERMYLSGKATYPIERTLLTTGLTAAGVDSLHAGQKRMETPHLAIVYQPTRESTFWRT